MAYKKISGVYKIFCTGNQKPYIGSAVSIKGRWATHLCALRKGRHGNKHLQNAWHKYGEASFQFSIILECEVSELTAKEQEWIDRLQAANPDLGMNNSFTASTTIGYRHSAQTRARLSAIAQAKDHSHLRALAESQKGKPAHNRGKPGPKWTDEQKRIASAQRKGRKPWNVGVPMDPEVRRRVSATLRGMGFSRTISDAVRAEIKLLRAGGMTYPKIAAATGVSLSQAHRIANDIVGREGRMRSYDKKNGTA